MNERIKEILKTIPELPGSYQMYDKDGTIIYVGKAKNLKNRVHSYFTGAHNAKTTALVSHIEDIKFMVTKSEREAFLLEISLIKEYHPFYNIDLMDDKTYPYIEFTKEANPKLIITRKISKKNTRIFGPYTNVTAARTTLDLLNKIYKLRKCSTLPKKPCIYKEIGECNAPCINPISKEEYDNIYKEIRAFLYGNDTTVVQALKKDMEEYSKSLDFENAKRCRDLINEIQDTTSRQSIILKDMIDVDVFGIDASDEQVSVSRIIVRNGKIVIKIDNVEPYYFDKEDAILTLIASIYESEEAPKNIFIDSDFKEALEGLVESNIQSPSKGDKRKLLDIAHNNASIALLNSEKVIIDKRRNALLELKNLLGISLPIRIESFDNSNLFGEYPVSSLVVYVDGKKSKNDYRKYIVKSVSGPNDFETMKEVVYRRYSRLKEEGKELPDLILMDGGKIQVNATLEILNYLGLNINVAGMKKNDKHETESLIFNDNEYPLDKHSSLYRFLFEVQEEVHRFAITYHRSTKNKGAFNSILDSIKGIGETLKHRLREEFLTIDNIKDASDERLKELGLNQKTIDTLKEKLNEETDFE